MHYPRIPFSIAISDDALLGIRWKEFSVAQQTILLAFYGEPLPTQAHHDAWAMLQGNAQFDEIGRVVSVAPTPYIPKPGGYRQLWAMLGRRSGKTTEIGAFIFAYECVLGGHMDPEYVRPGQEVYAFLVSQKKDIAIANLSSIKLLLESSPGLREEIKNSLAESIELENGLIIAAAAPDIRGRRGLACPVIGMDEVGFWYKDAESANPDYEVERALSAAQMQFPNFVRFGISTPWSKEGLLWKHHAAGTDGKRLVREEEETEDQYIERKREYEDVLWCEGPTAAIRCTPTIEKFLRRELRRDPGGFAREYLAQFADTTETFIPFTLVTAARSEGVKKRESLLTTEAQAEQLRETGRKVIPAYVAAIDPAFRRDSFTFTIAHLDEKGRVVEDLLLEWVPAPGDRLKPGPILDEIAAKLKEYDVKEVFCDQYQIDALQSLCLDRGFTLSQVSFTQTSKPRIFGNLQQLYTQRLYDGLDGRVNPVAARAELQVSQLQRIKRPNGSVAIQHPPGKHDDLATVRAIAAFKAIWMPPQVEDMQAEDEVVVEPSIFERCMATLARKKQEKDHWNDGMSF